MRVSLSYSFIELSNAFVLADLEPSIINILCGSSGIDGDLF